MRYRRRPVFKMWIVLIVISALVTAFLPLSLKYIYPLKYKSHIEYCSQKYEIDKYLIMGIISAESNFDSNAQSNKDAHGLMQLKDETAVWCVEHFEMDIQKNDIRTPKSNIEIGCVYMNYLTQLFDGDVLTAIAAYNAGPGNVNKWLSDPRYSDGKGKLEKIPFSETAAYVNKVQKRAKIYRKIYS